jgi:dTDP-4-dehydrorhamnose 3,5-epimerase
MAWLPRGFAHGFLTLSESAEVLYKLDEFWSPPHERTLPWNDADIGVRWPLQGEPILSDKDRRGTPFRSADLFD